ncbi:MAG: TonB family protein [Phenylobacterium sp.]|jgi:TonB family protein
MKSKSFISVILFSALPLTTLADETNQAKVEPASINAKAVNRVEPKFPRSAAANGYEGWVRLSYVIGTDGKVTDAFVTDSSGLRTFEKAAMNAVKQWQYTPAIEDGKAVVQCKNSVQLTFSLEQANKEISRKFHRSYKKAATAINAKDLAASRTILDKMISKPRKNFNEEGLLWQLNGHYYRLTGDIEQELKNFKRSINVINPLTHNPKVYLASLENIFILQLKTNKLSGALYTYNKISKVKENQEVLESLEPLKKQIDALVAGDKYIVVPQKVGKRGFSQYYLARNSFQFDNVKGDLDKLSIYCDKQKQDFKFTTSNVWSIPKSWGQCSVYVYGDTDSSFDIVELPAQA